MLVKAADIVAVSLDELVGRQAHISEPAIKNAELHQLVQEVDQLPDREQQAVIIMLDGLLRSAQVTRPSTAVAADVQPRAEPEGPIRTRQPKYAEGRASA